MFLKEFVLKPLAYGLLVALVIGLIIGGIEYFPKVACGVILLGAVWMVGAGVMYGVEG